MKPLIQTVLVLVFVVSGTGIVMSQPSEFHLIKKIAIGGDGGWDYLSVDALNRKLYVSHSTQVEIIDLNSKTKVGAIENLNGVHGIGLVSKLGKGITTNGRSKTATIFDLKTYAKLGDLTTGENPDALTFDNFSNRMFVFNHSGGTASVIDMITAKVVGTVALGGEGVEAGVSDEAGTIYVNLEDKNEIVSFDAKSLAVKNRWKIGTGEEPTGLGIDRMNHRLFAVCGNGVMIVLNYDNGKIISTVPIGDGCDGVVVDNELKVAFASNGEGTITVVQTANPSSYKVLQTIKSEPGARTITLDPTTHHVFVSTAKYTTAPSEENRRPSVAPGSFMVLEYGR